MLKEYRVIGFLLLYLLFSLWALMPVKGFASETPAQSHWWSLELPHRPEKPRSDLLFPFISFVVPSFDQFFERQYKGASFYLAYSIVGTAEMMSGMTDEKQTNDTAKLFSSKDEKLRRLNLGGQMVQTAGSLSAFHSFRSAVESRRSLGEYSFLTVKEDSADLLKAPFKFGFLMEPTTWIPLALEILAVSVDFKNFKGKTQFTGADAAYTTAFSYQAGVGEEAVFRGWLMPYMANRGWSPFASNLMTATTFALAHLSASNRVPWPQFLMGFYFGQVSLWNNWSIQENIFIHTWWDIIAIGSSWALADENKDKAIYLPLLDIPISL